MALRVWVRKNIFSFLLCSRCLAWDLNHGVLGYRNCQMLLYTKTSVSFSYSNWNVRLQMGLSVMCIVFQTRCVWNASVCALLYSYTLSLCCKTVSIQYVFLFFFFFFSNRKLLVMLTIFFCFGCFCKRMNAFRVWATLTLTTFILYKKKK